MSALAQIIRADLRERTRRPSFLVLLGLVLFIGYLVNIGQITLRLERYRGVINSAWAGSMMALVITFLLGWFGFYLVRGSISRDEETGVGQILATTPISRAGYMLGKWLSNVLLLALLVGILLLAAVVMQLIQREDAQIQLWALVAPALFVALPFMALVAALAVCFESVRWLRGGVGNLVYFFLFIGVITPLAIIQGGQHPLLDWLGFGLFKQSMAAAAHAAYPAYQGGLALSMAPAAEELQAFAWPGVTWTGPLIATRMATLIWALGLVLLGALGFDRFDPTGGRVGLRRAGRPAPPDALPLGQVAGDAAPARPAPQLTPLPAARPRLRLGARLLAELRLLLQGLAWWWYLGALGLIAASALLPLASVRHSLLPATLIWPVFVWGGLGCREARHNTRQLLFAAPRPLWGQLPAAWLAGLAVTAALCGGVGLRLALAGELASLGALLAGVLFIPSLALALGVWSGGSKAFEVVYVLLWYLGPLNQVRELDFPGIHGSGYGPLYALLSAALVALAIIGRRRQLRG